MPLPLLAAVLGALGNVGSAAASTLAGAAGSAAGTIASGAGAALSGAGGALSSLGATGAGGALTGAGGALSGAGSTLSGLGGTVADALGTSGAGQSGIIDQLFHGNIPGAASKGLESLGVPAQYAKPIGELSAAPSPYGSRRDEEADPLPMQSAMALRRNPVRSIFTRQGY